MNGGYGAVLNVHSQILNQIKIKLGFKAVNNTTSKHEANTAHTAYILLKFVTYTPINRDKSHNKSNQTLS